MRVVKLLAANNAGASIGSCCSRLPSPAFWHHLLSHDEGDACWCDAVLPCYGGLSLTVPITATDCGVLVHRDLVPLISAATFACSISIVVSSGSREQVVRSHTRRIVAMVANLEMRVERSV